MSWKGPHTIARGPLAGRFFETQQDYQNELARVRGTRTYAEFRSRPSGIPLSQLPGRLMRTWRKAQGVFGELLQGKSLSRAARERRIAPTTVHRFLGPKLER